MLGGLAGASTIASIVLWKSYFTSPDSEKPLTMIVKLGVLSIQKREYGKAQEYFHKALEMAYEKHKKKEMDDKYDKIFNHVDMLQLYN